MADAATMDAPPTAIADLAGGEDKSMGGLVSSLTNIDRQKLKADTKITAESDEQQARDRAVRNHAFQMEGVAASEIPKPWDADKEHKKWEANPIEGFGSMGGLFAMVASAFTKAPMENAINGMAGAINSIKDGNEQGYQRAYDAFKTNVKLADQRFKTQHELYSDALNLGTADAAASDAKLRNAAVRFGDQHILMLAEHGMIKEIYELQAARASAHEAMMKAAEATDLHTVQKAAIEAVKKNPPNTGDPTRDKMLLAAQVHNIYAGGGLETGTPVQEAVGAYVQTHDPKDPKFVDGLADIYAQFSAKAPNIQGYQDARQAAMDANNGTITPDEDAKLLQQFGLTNVRSGAGGGGNSQSSQARKTRAIEEIQKKHADEGKPITIAEAEREYNKTVQIPSAHDVHSDDIQYAKAERMESAMDELDGLLVKHKFMTGIGGTITRPVEALSNILGSNETDRKQFQRVATELKEWGQSVVNDRTGRPLSSEAKDAAVIFAGLNPGDTSANTIRAITELRPVIAKIKEQIRARGQGKGPVSGGETPAAPAKEEGGKRPLWESAPVKGGGDRSEASRPLGPVMSDADPEPVRAGAKYAQASIPASDTRSLPSFSVDEMRPYRNKEVPPGSYPRVSVDNQENRVVIDKSYGNLDEFGYKKIRELRNKYKLGPGEKVLLIDKQGHQFGYKRDDSYDGGFTFWMPYEEEGGS
jgi:hypothetical protein